jgi:esterase/lipase superfamily enzyme
VTVVANSGGVERTAVSDLNGYFDLGELPAGEVAFRILVDGELRGERTLGLPPGPISLRVSPGGWVDVQPSRIEGYVGGDWAALEGRVVSAENTETGERFEVAVEGTSFELGPLPSARYRVRLRSGTEVFAETTLHLGWLAREVVDFDPESGVEHRLGFFRGTVRDGEGRDLEDATLAITNVQTGAVRRLETGEFGRFGDDETEGMPEAMYLVQVERGGEVLFEQRLRLHPYMLIEISTLEGIRESGAEAAAVGTDDDNYHRVRIFYGTDRKQTGNDAPADFYGGERGVLELGVCEVSIPLDHRIGELESPSFWRLEFRQDPEKHVVLLSVEQQPRNTFAAELRGSIKNSESQAAFVFVHGYNVSFEDAARRTGQMAYDLNFDGAPILYSWPSKASLQGYMADEASAQWTVPHLEEFLELVASESGAKTVHLIAHSMGNRPLTTALGRFTQRDDGPRFSQIALVAPDIDADIFKRDIAPHIPRAGERVTLYASANDQALKASRHVHDTPRAGEAGDRLVVVPGVDTIDVSLLDTSLLGHSYYGENLSVISDLFHLLKSGFAPGQRFGLDSVPAGALRYWRFRAVAP